MSGLKFYCCAVDRPVTKCGGLLEDQVAALRAELAQVKVERDVLKSENVMLRHNGNLLIEGAFDADAELLQVKVALMRALECMQEHDETEAFNCGRCFPVVCDLARAALARPEKTEDEG